MKVLVRTPNWVGDAVMAIPALREIRRAFPGSEVTILSRPWTADLYRREGLCDEVLLYGGSRWRAASEARARRFDCAILLPNALDAAVVAFLARIPRRIGYARDGRGLLLTDPIAPPKPGEIPAHERYYYLELLRRAGLISALPECSEIRLRADAEAGRAGFRGFGLRGDRVIGLAPGAANSQAKQWPAERFAAVGSELSRRWDAEVAVFGSTGERELAAGVAARIGPPAHNLAGRTALGQLVDLAAACEVVVTNDSGAMHIAAAAGVPTVAVFGPTDADATGPASGSACIVRTPVECSPCGHRRCPIDHRCMLRVEPEAVVEAAQRLVRGRLRKETAGEAV